jgi:hypothetical protein
LFISFFFFAGLVNAQEKKGFIQRTLDWGYNIVQGDSAKPYKKYYFVVPIVAYRPESRWILGISMAHIFRTQLGDSITRPSIIRANISYSQEHQFSFKPYVEIFTKRNMWDFRFQYQYTNFAEYFWGIGVEAPKDNKELYKFRMHKANVKAAYKFLPNFYAGVQFGLEKMYDVSYQEGSKLQNSDVSGKGGYSAIGTGLTCYYDDRENVYFPYHGQIVELSTMIYNDIWGSGYNFMNITLDARKYQHLWKENILAYQFYMNLNQGDIPFRMMGTLGSDSYMRGYYTGRYRDNNAFAVQAELRKTIWGPLGCTVFAGCGTVSSDFGGLASQIKPNIGAGLRFKAIPRERVNVRMDYGFGVDGNQAFYLTLNEAF